MPAHTASTSSFPPEPAPMIRRLLPHLSRRRRLWSLTACGLVTLACAFGQATDYTEFSLEELALVRISTLGRKQTALIDTPGAAYIVTRDDIHRTAALDFAEALRFVPGLQVARVNSFDYAITIRGFNDATSNKLLVQMDGRSLYSTTYSGTYWNFHELIMPDVERIEVLRGPGASLWGANAMNGVVNIVNRSTDDTLGALATTAIGDQLDISAALRYGWRVSDHITARVYAKYQKQDSYGIDSGTASGGWNNRLAGTRAEWSRPAGGRLTLIGEYRESRVPSISQLPSLTPSFYYDPTPETRLTRGGNLSAHYEQPVFGDGQLSLLGSFEHYESAQITSDESRDTFGLDLQLTLPLGTRNELITGATYREDHDDLTGSSWISYSDPSARTIFTGAFVQDELTFIPDRLSLTAGAKFERNSFSGWEFQPSARAIWTPAPKQRLWLGVSRAARTPTRTETSVDWYAATIPPTSSIPLPVAVHARGTSAFDSEYVTAYELGYRFEPTVRLALDLALFHNDYDRLRGVVQNDVYTVPFPVPYIYAGYDAANNVTGTTDGGELTVRWQPDSHWTVDGSVSVLTYDIHSSGPTGLFADPTPSALTGSSPRYEGKLRIGWDPVSTWSFDLMLRQVDKLESQHVPAYTGVDARVAWQPRPDWEFELIGRDLTDPYHPESATFFLSADAREIARSFFLRVTYRH